MEIYLGPCRIRRKLIPDPKFYHRYPYRLHLDVPEAKSQRAKVAISRDAKFYFERMSRKRFHTMDERIIDKSTVPTSQSFFGGTSVSVLQSEDASENILDLNVELNLSIIKRMVQKNLLITEKTSKEEVVLKIYNLKQLILVYRSIINILLLV